jgi:Asp-tRNA(Asn)/Glu-tRNA(Gln) amidotransferase A subunit family amidase
MYINRASLGLFHKGFEPSDDLLHEYLEKHMNLYSKVEPHIQAFINETDRAERIMKETLHLSHSYARGTKPPLFGIPVGVKDLIHVDGFPTLAGSNLPTFELTGKEGRFIATLREKGVIFAGKTVTEEFAYAGPIPTRNPHDLNHTPGGSSAGSAACVAAGMCHFAIGTQTLRSVIAPASFCGVVGFKPSFDRIPMDGVVLLSPSFDTMGLFTQDIESMEFLTSHLVPEWKPLQSERTPVLGIPNGVYMTLLSDDAKITFFTQLDQLEKAGFTLKTVDMPWDDDFIYGDAMIRFILGEMAQVHTPWFDKYKECYGPAVRNAILTGQTIEDEELDRYRQGQISLRHDLMEIQRREGIDIWVSPSQAGVAPLWGERTGWVGMTAIWSYAGCPAISIPSAMFNNLPLGFQCIGSYGNDEELLFWSKQVSQVLNSKVT